ncbi:MAG: hypothetical protein NTX51_11905 [Verrucomicrobia bacterium]|nr:hypothetical protein [Verrucomicrobiota bacterium]
MSDRLGMVQYGSDDEYGFLGRAYRTAKDLLTVNYDKLELIATSLLEYETLDGQQVQEIVRTGKFTPPPPAPQVDPPRGAPAGTPLPETPTKSAPPELPGLGTPAPATA